ncbi:MAG: hypothetical protein ACXV49_09790 [Halobacteriota archaeon]
MELDVNQGAHDLVWRLMSPSSKKRYLQNIGPLKAELFDREIARFVNDGYLKRDDADLALTSKGKDLYQQLTKKGCCQPG